MAGEPTLSELLRSVDNIREQAVKTRIRGALIDLRLVRAPDAIGQAMFGSQLASSLGGMKVHLTDGSHHRPRCSRAGGAVRRRPGARIRHRVRSGSPAARHGVTAFAQTKRGGGESSPNSGRSSRGFPPDPQALRAVCNCLQGARVFELNSSIADRPNVSFPAISRLAQLQ